MEPLWEIQRPDPVLLDHLQQNLSCRPATAAVLANRQIADAEQARCFISDGLGQLPDPFDLVDLDRAARRIYTALKKNENILIFGDYDVDGITATALMVQFLAYLGARVDYYVPHRTREGYGLKPIHIESVAVPRKIDLIITVDCGSTALEALKLAAAAGIDVIVTDHHRVDEELPPALALINPHRPDCPSGLELLSGAGVAFYLLIFLRKYLREHQFWTTRPEPALKAICDLTALGTVADMMPLSGANRLLVKAGLEIINGQPRMGLKALMRASRLVPGTVDAEDLAFRLIPRLNAAGRMGHANSAVRLLITPRQDQAEHLAQNLDKLNQQRQQVEGKLVADIITHLEANPAMLKFPALVLADTGWHEGVLGIAASRVARRFHRPVVIMTLRDGLYRGSARSIAGFDLFNGLVACQADLAAFGGHSMAAGLQVAPDKLDVFREHFQNVAARKLDGENNRPVLTIDAELPLNQIDRRLFDELELLQPFGHQNPQPLFMTRDVTVASHRKMGKGHRRMVLEQNGATMEALHFNIDPRHKPPRRMAQIAFQLKWNNWRGADRPQILLKAVEFPIAS